MLTNNGILFLIACSVFLHVFLITVWFSTRSSLTHVRPTTHYICPSWSGRLGNIMFQYASLYGIAAINGMTLIINDFADITLPFDNLYAEKVHNESICDVVWGESKPCAYDEDAMFVDTTNDVLHDSYLQSWRYFQHVEDDIRDQFRFSEDIDIFCQELVDGAVQNFSSKISGDVIDDLQIVGVHIRRGDYLLENNIEFGYQTATEEYLNKSMNHFRNLFKYVVFLIYTNPNSNDTQWRQDHVIGNDVIMMPMMSPEIDMCSLSKCNHSIITVGSFGWWAAWLADGVTIYFKDMARNGSEYRDDFSEDMSDYIYPGWIGL